MMSYMVTYGLFYSADIDPIEASNWVALYGTADRIN